ncbi:hypothetical protein [Geomonas sp.]|uniref:hypothetical protein n=1 Tax=Geomonas sp. TaxID=2651584 RepID=UPI002B48760F|nr:hypothetical protein [Geomonas sp.]HJV37115.1 hypothetical protein [Geomonas sp.]
MTSDKNGSDKDNSENKSLHLEGPAPTLSELYPQVSRILLFVAFEVADSESEPNYQQIIFTPDAEAAFRLDCSREECLHGGFDFAPIIQEMIKRDDSRIHGRLECQGTLPPGGEACRLKAEYRIIID